MTPKEQAHFRILTLLRENPSLSQQELAKRLGISVGKVNYLVKALVEKGQVKMGNFQRSGNKMDKVAYLLTPSGIGERIRLTRAYLARKKIEYQALKTEIEALEKESLHSAATKRRRA